MGTWTHREEALSKHGRIWGFANIKGTFCGLPVISIIVYWGLYCGPPFFGKLPYGSHEQRLKFEDPARCEEEEGGIGASGTKYNNLRV